MGRRSKRNDSGISGLLLINKDAGMTSHDVVSKVRWLAGTRRVGHTGTLDPDATGLLPITLGHCTKLANFLILDEKVYEFELELGLRLELGFELRYYSPYLLEALAAVLQQKKSK